MSFSLVLGGGGVIGVAWETGIATGLLEGGFDPRTADAIVGTSAGAMVGAQLASGRMPDAPSAPTSGAAAARPLIDRTTLDIPALGKVFTMWGAMQTSTLEEVSAIGQIARVLNRAGEPGWVETISAMISVTQWPDARLLVAVVDTETGARRIFDKQSTTPLGRAVAASSAVPGLFPSIEIEGRLYMDGQVHSSTNADALLAHTSGTAKRALVAMPTNALTSAGIGGHAERMLEVEVAALRAAGWEVLVRTPGEQDAKRLGSNLMDAAKAPEAYAVGLETGRAWASELR